jgi:hypothetical protein
VAKVLAHDLLELVDPVEDAHGCSSQSTGPPAT